MLERAVLFVDDEPSILNSLRRLCRREDYRVHIAAGGEEGLDLLQRQPVPVIVSDYRMPGMTGVEFLAKVKAILPDSVRVILSGYANADVIVDAINKGEIFRFLPKPWDDHELLATVRQCLDHYYLTRENALLSAQTSKQNEQLRQMNEALENAVAERTRSLALSQDVLEHLPIPVLGISREGEIVLTNQHARQSFASLASTIPGTELAEVFTADIVEAIEQSLHTNHDGTFVCELDGHRVDVTVSPLDSGGAERGCVLMLTHKES